MYKLDVQNVYRIVKVYKHQILILKKKLVGEKESFDREFQEKSKESMRGLEYRRRGERSDRRALPEPTQRRGYRDREGREKN